MHTENAKRLGSIQNNDINNILCQAETPADMTPQAYRDAVAHLLEGKPCVLAQTVGQPDPVIYRTRVATAFDKYLVDVSMKVYEDIWAVDNADPEGIRRNAAAQAEYVARLLAAGTSPFEITIEACHEAGVPVLASYRMNGEDWYHRSHELYDLGRWHPEYRIPFTDREKTLMVEGLERLPAEKRPRVDPDFTGALDYAVPEVLEQRLRMFTEVATLYDIDGIEFDFRRWTHMISRPLENYPVLTELVRRTREMLDRTAEQKGRGRMLLCVRVGPSLDDPADTEYPGGNISTDFSSRLLGLDVAAWIEQELVDAVCPSLFWPALPGLPRVGEFVNLAQSRNVGIYPTVFPRPAWSEDEPGEGKTMADLPDSQVAALMRRHRDEICQAALQCYEQGADGVSTYNWFGHALYGPRIQRHGLTGQNYRASQANGKTELFVHAFVSSPDSLRKCLAAEPVVTDGECEWRL